MIINGLTSGSLIVVALIHIAPLIGVLGGAQLLALYGKNISDPDILLLMRHRAVLFGLLGAFFMFAAFNQTFQWAAILMGSVSMLTFIILALHSPARSAQLSSILLVDGIGLGFILLTIGAKLIRAH